MLPSDSLAMLSVSYNHNLLFIRLVFIWSKPNLLSVFGKLTRQFYANCHSNDFYMFFIALSNVECTYLIGIYYKLVREEGLSDKAEIIVNSTY